MFDHKPWYDVGPLLPPISRPKATRLSILGQTKLQLQFRPPFAFAHLHHRARGETDRGDSAQSPWAPQRLLPPLSNPPRVTCDPNQPPRADRRAGDASHGAAAGGGDRAGVRRGRPHRPLRTGNQMAAPFSLSIRLVHSLP
jgi:hypothetical protein